jgi:alpha-D-ribose 1-methylphosphonate 5-phosphate C-P lyase
MHALSEYGGMHVRFYEDIAHYGRIATSYDYPVIVNDRYLMRPSPIPKFDTPKMHHARALMLFGAGREKRIYAVPPFTGVEPLDFADHPFAIERWSRACALCGSRASYLDEIITDDQGQRLFVCSDTDFCAAPRAPGEAAE